MLPLIKINNYLTDVEGIALYPIITLLIFTLFFALVLILVFKTDKKTLEQNSKLPLDNDPEIPMLRDETNLSNK